jgi:FkbM family methyltransferase
MNYNVLLVSQKIKINFKIENIFYKSKKNSSILNYSTTKNNNFYFMDTCCKSNWKDYYNNYNDDDIVFIDLNKLPNFIEFIKNSNYDLVFANTINNCVSAYYQQNKYNLIQSTTINDTNDSDINNRLEKIHANLKFNHGSLNDELPEQKMVIRYFTGNEKVLEIGSNTGRSSLIIASILSNVNNFVTLESDTDIANKLIENRDLNNFSFHIENSALSKRKLIQRGWDTKESDVLLDGHKWVNIITLEQLNAKYNIVFDTLVLDCEGAFYYILKDMPEILTNINLIVMENDYINLSHKEYIDGVMLKSGFDREYIEAGGWEPCYHNFFEVWKRK